MNPRKFPSLIFVPIFQILFRTLTLFLFFGLFDDADEVELEEDEREPVGGDGLNEGREVDDDDEYEEEGINNDWFGILPFVRCKIFLLSSIFLVFFCVWGCWMVAGGDMVAVVGRHG